MSKQYILRFVLITLAVVTWVMDASLSDLAWMSLILGWLHKSIGY